MGILVDADGRVHTPEALNVWPKHSFDILMEGYDPIEAQTGIGRRFFAKPWPVRGVPIPVGTCPFNIREQPANRVI